MTANLPCDVYFASCTPDGGVWRYRLLPDGQFQPTGFVPMDQPMYLARQGDVIHALLRQPFAGEPHSGLVHFNLGAFDDPASHPVSHAISTQGQATCHLSILDGVVYAASYSSGSLIRIPPSGPAQTVEHHGHSIDEQRQSMPHPHCITPSPKGDVLLVADLGTDRIHVYDVHLNLLSSMPVKPGQGPRHLAFGEQGRVYVANELNSTVSVLRLADARLTYLHDYPLIPAHWQGESYPAAIRIAGNRVYVSNRGHDSITCFDIDNDALRLVACVPCGGHWPRDFNITPDSKTLICAHERSHAITFFSLTAKGLSPRPASIDMPWPICVIF